MNNFRSALIVLLITALSSGCGSFRFPGVFKIDIAQGNIVTQEMLDQLKPGMTRRQVLYVMGSPMLTDTFNDNRWDYYLSFREGANDPETQNIIVYFSENRFTHYVGELNEALDFSDGTLGQSKK